MDYFFVILIEILYSIASLVLLGAGLAIIFGMMKVINLAHGEFMMLGGYVTITSVNYGINIFLSILIIA
ncbi:MAG: branched-chain amino acid ABC transporter permease, partial [Rhodobacteraceae bacterium]|nr:branched-chain amino acid ABC transporter permease [Paracoccaceae bacterium]